MAAASALKATRFTFWPEGLGDHSAAEWIEIEDGWVYVTVTVTRPSPVSDGPHPAAPLPDEAQPSLSQERS